MRRDVFGCAGDVTHVGLAILVERRRNADDDRVHLGNAGEIGGRREPMRARSLDLFGLDSNDVGAAGVDRVDFALVDIEPSDGKLLLTEQQGEWQADVTKAYNADLCRAGLDLG